MAYSKEQKEEIFKEVFDRMGQGESLRSILSNKDMPHRDTFYVWLDADKSKSDRYAHAMQERADAIFEEIIDIADENNADVYVNDLGEAKIDGNNIQRSRLRVDARKWVVSKLNPKKYGNKEFIEQKTTHDFEGDPFAKIRENAGVKAAPEKPKE